MKITFVAPYASLAGGIRVVAIYAELLHKLGHEVFIVSKPKAQPTLKEQTRSLFKGKGLIRVTQGPSHFDHINPQIQHKVIESARRFQDSDVPDADAIIATWWETAEEIASLSSSKGRKIYFIQQHETHQGQPIERVKATYRLPFHKITISKWLIDLMESEYGDKDVSLVLNSVECDRFYAPKRNKQDIPTVGMLYKPTFHKGCDVSFKAIAKATRSIPNLKLIAFGACDPSPDFPLPAGTEYIKQPPQDLIKEIYAKCDVWLCGSRSEGFHLPPLEAMACRCPVVSTEVGGPLDTIEEGVNGYLVPVEDDEALADRLVKMLSLSQEDWQSMSDAAYATATQYTWEDATKLFESALYRSLHPEK
jgi:glycosyltransferase involved in cell wall biosynthesis